jgi:signal peptidase I
MPMITTSLSKSFDWSGRAPRKEVWLLWAFAALVCSATIAAEYWGAQGLGIDGPVFLPRLVYVAAGLLFIPLTAAMIRRAHDAGRSGAWVLVMLVPVLGAFAGLYLLIAPSSSRRRAPDAPLAMLVLAVSTIAVSVLFMSRAFWQPYWIPANSMAPTLLAGDYVTVSRPFNYRPEAGDIVVFRHVTSQTDFIKRVIGMPGDTVQMRAGIVYLNGEALPQEDAGNFEEIFGPKGPGAALPRCANGPVGIGGICSSPRKIETLPGGTKHAILDISVTPHDDTIVFLVPPEHYFVMGDNRDNSIDSRFSAEVGGAGMVPAAYIIGHGRRVVFSAAGPSLYAFWDWRAGRFFKALQ